MNNLDKNYQYFVDNLENLIKEYKGKFLVIHNQKIVGVYDNELEAYNDSSKKYGLGEFIIQKCVKEEDQTAVFHSRVVFN